LNRITYGWKTLTPLHCLESFLVGFAHSAACVTLSQKSCHASFRFGDLQSYRITQKSDTVSAGDCMATLFRLFLSGITFLTFFYSTTFMMSYLYALDRAPLAVR
jgi:hypothetical protein